MILDLNAFRTGLLEAEKQKPVDDIYLSDYLRNHLLIPYMNGEDISLDELDYGAFELDDLELLDHYADELARKSRGMQHIPENLVKCPASVRAVRQFC